MAPKSIAWVLPTAVQNTRVLSRTPAAIKTTKVIVGYSSTLIRLVDGVKVGKC